MTVVTRSAERNVRHRRASILEAAYLRAPLRRRPCSPDSTLYSKTILEQRRSFTVRNYTSLQENSWRSSYDFSNSKSRPRSDLFGPFGKFSVSQNMSGKKFKNAVNCVCSQLYYLFITNANKASGNHNRSFGHILWTQKHRRQSGLGIGTPYF